LVMEVNNSLRSHLTPKDQNQQICDALERVLQIEVDQFEKNQRVDLLEFIDWFRTNHHFQATTKKELIIEIANKMIYTDLCRFVFLFRGCDFDTTDRLFDRKFLNESKEIMDQVFLRIPLVKATQERFNIFQQLTQKLLKDGLSLCSIPCGKMRDLLTLNFHDLKNITLHGIDKDSKALEGATEFKNELNMTQNSNVANIQFHLRDALKPFSEDALFNVVTSNGLNIYLDDDDCMTFYTNVYLSLAPGGIFIMSQIVPPNEWSSSINSFDLMIQRLIFGIISPLWTSHARPCSQVLSQLNGIGFRQIQKHDSLFGMFPCFTAIKE